jgi:rubrerythrin
MAEFVNPHNQMDADRKYTTSELIRALRKDLSAEEEATSLYTAHAEMTNDKSIKQALLDIADEERVHVGELQALINKLAKDEKKLLDKGMKEVEKLSPNKIADEMESEGESTEEIRRIANLI